MFGSCKGKQYTSFFGNQLSDLYQKLQICYLRLFFVDLNVKTLFFYFRDHFYIKFVSLYVRGRRLCTPGLALAKRRFLPFLMGEGRTGGLQFYL